MKRIAIAVLIIGVVIAIAVSTQSRLPRVEDADGTAPGEVAVDPATGRPGDAPAAADSLTADAAASDSAGNGPAARSTDGSSPTESGGAARSAPPAGQGGGSDAPTSGDVPTPPAQSSQLPSAAQILERASAAYADVRSMQADFAMAMTNPLLRRTTNSRGTLYQRRPDRIALRFSEPQGDVIVGDGTHFWIYYPSVDEKQVIRMPASQGASGGVDLQSQFVGDPTERFRSTLHGTERVGGRDAYVLTLEPRAPAGYTALKVWLDTRDYLARRFEIVQENGAVRRFDLSNLRTNLTLGDATFRFTLPADARIVDRS